VNSNRGLELRGNQAYENSVEANMYKNFFGLRESPFNINPNPRYLLFTSQVEEAVDELIYGIQTRKGLILLTGEVGTGKTTLIHRLLDWLQQQEIPVAFIFDSHLEIGHLYGLILAEFGVKFDSRVKSNALLHLKRWLSDCYCAGKTAVLIMDEAQDLPVEALEEIRMLLNLETPREKLLQVVLAGQPELEETLRRPELYPLRQRIALRCKTAPLSLQETHQYIRERLRLAGAKDEHPVFSSEAIDAVHFFSRGIPRVMNLLSEQALIHAYVEQTRPVPARLVTQVACEFELQQIEALHPPANFGGVKSDEVISKATTDSSALFEVAKPLVDCQSIPVPENELEARAYLRIPVPPLVAPDSNRTASGQQLDSIGLSAESGADMGAHMAREADPSPSLSSHLRLVEAEANGHVSSATAHGQIPARGEARRRAPRESGRRAILYTLLCVNRWRIRWTDRYLSIIIPRSWPQIGAVLLRWLEKPIGPGRALHLWRFGWRDRYLAIFDSIDWMQMTASLSRWLREPFDPVRWLQEPFDPTQWLAAIPQLFDSRRTLSHRKP
jgi:general secretion pathway protein A